MNGKSIGASLSLVTALLAPVLVLAASVAGCGSSTPAGYSPPPLAPDEDASVLSDGGKATKHKDGGTGTGGDDDDDDDTGASSDGGGGGADADVPVYAAAFRYVPPAGMSAHVVSLAGEWNNFNLKGTPMVGPDASGAFTATVNLPVGMTAYELVVDGAATIDTAAKFRKYVGASEFSAVLVLDGSLPSLTVASHTVSRPSAGKGEYKAEVDFAPAVSASPLDPTTVKATLRKDGVTTSVPSSVDGSGHVTFDITGLADGKYTAFVDASDKSGHAAPSARLVFWIEASTFDWQDAVLYMVMTDRFQDGDPANNVAPTSGVDPREQYQGGDYEGITAQINAGYFDNLGIRTLWLSPFNTGPSDPWIASDNVHQTMGYHGYWPIKAREVDPRFGGDTALKALTAAAHAHGLRVIQDLVINQVHQEHEYFIAHPEWFRTGCVCGTDNCDWTVHRLDCLFATYMPDVNWTLQPVNDQFDSDAIWWMDTFDLDGFRMDAVKQVEDTATINLSGRLRAEFEQAGNPIFLTGETAMGWDGSGCGLSCNVTENYSYINAYIGPNDLTGQFDFVAYYAVPMQSFVADYQGMGQVDYWTQASGWEYPTGSIMSPYIGSQDTARFVTIANDNALNAYNQWTNIATAPTDPVAYQRHRMALAWELTIPGAPMIYYGDEYSEWGGVDPNNRVTWRGASSGLSTAESTTKTTVTKLLAARKSLEPLRRGDYEPVTVSASGTGLIFARNENGNVVFVAMSKSTSGETITATLPPTLSLPTGTVLHDSMGGSNVTVQSGGAISVTLPSWGVAILSP
jgi:glycosidase